jgi:hypothetical protein
MKKIKADVIDNQAVIRTGAVERYFKKSFIICNNIYILECKK